MRKHIQERIFIILMVFALCSVVKNQEITSGNQNRIDYVSNSAPQIDGRISRSEKLRIQERQKFNSIQKTVGVGTKFSDFLFTVKGVEQFLLNLPVAQQVAIGMFTYVMTDNAYMQLRNVQNQPPIKVFIYENNNRLIHQSDFYFQNYIVFEGQQLSTYTIRFINAGVEKLIVMSVKKLTESIHLEEVLGKEEVFTHAVKANRLLEQLKFLANSFERYTMLNFQAVKMVLGNFNLYYYWNIVQTTIAIIVCAIQMTFIRKICKQPSIV